MEQSEHLVDENVGEVEVCVKLVVTGEFLEDIIANIDTENGSAKSPDDFSPVSISLIFSAGYHTECVQCVQIPIVEDDTVELDIEHFSVNISTKNTSVSIRRGSAVVTIHDDDTVMMLLHLKDDALSETKDVIEVCAFLDNGHRPGGKCPVMFPVIISASIDNAAVTHMDSVQTALLMVPECGIESCVNISIKDALVVEMDAFLNVSLASIDIPGQERILNSTSVKGAINIADNEAVVGLERPVYHVSGGDDVVEVCVIVYSPDIDCPVAFPFSVLLSTDIGCKDSTLCNFTLMTFGACVRKNCTVLNNIKQMKTTRFNMILERTPDLNERITLYPVNGVIVISGVCPRLTDPDNGFLVIMTGVSEGHVAGFLCKFGYKLVGATVLTCRNGQWSDPPPVCESFAFVSYFERDEADGSVFVELVVTGGYLNRDKVVNVSIQDLSSSPMSETSISLSLNFSKSSPPAPLKGRHTDMTGETHCIEAGFYTCCSDKANYCKAAGSGGNCYCSAMCHLSNNCCDDIQRICPAYRKKVPIDKSGKFKLNISADSSVLIIGGTVVVTM